MGCLCPCLVFVVKGLHQVRLIVCAIAVSISQLLRLFGSSGRIGGEEAVWGMR